MPPGYLSRPRLLARLDDADFRLAVVRGPAGSGKSALLCDWVRRSASDDAVLWISLDQHSASRARFWQLLASTARSAAERSADVVGRIALALPDASASPGMLLHALEQYEAHITVVLDDLHHLDEDIIGDLLWVIERSTRLRVAVATQRVHALEHPESVARIRTVVISSAELAFTLDETQSLVARSARPDRAAATEIHGRTDGHALTTRIAIPQHEGAPVSRLTDQPDDAFPGIADIIVAERYDLLWPHMVAQSITLQPADLREVEQVLLGLPLDLLRTHGEIAIILAMLRSAREQSPSARTTMLVERAFETLLPRCDAEASVDRVRALAAVLAGLRAAGRPSETAAVADAIVETVRQLAPRERARSARWIDAVLVHVAATYIAHGRFDAALRVARDAHSGEHPPQSARLGELADVARAMRGDLRARPRTGRGRPGASGSASRRGLLDRRIASAIRLVEEGSAERAIAALDEIDEDLPRHDAWAFAIWAKGLARLLAGDAGLGADEVMTGMREFRGRPLSPAGAGLLSAIASDLLLAAGQRDRAMRVLADAPGTSPAVALARSRHAFASERFADARALVEPIAWNDAGDPRHQAEALLVRAAIDVRLDLPGEARESARRAIGVMGPCGLRSPLAMVPRRDLAEALSADDGGWADLLDAVGDPFGQALARNTLTPRELEVLAQLAFSPNLEAVAAALYVSINTVKTQVRSIYRKLEVSSREDAVRSARNRGLIPG